MMRLRGLRRQGIRLLGGGGREGAIEVRRRVWGDLDGLLGRVYIGGNDS